MSNSKSLEETSEECRKLQLNAAEKLRQIANLLREKQKEMNIAKVSFNSAGVVAGGLSIAGLVLAPFTAGISIGLLAVGGGLGVAAGAGGIGTNVAEWKVVGSKVEEAEAVLADLTENLNIMIEKMKVELKKQGLTDNDIASMFVLEGGKWVYNVARLGKIIRKAVAIARAGSKAGTLAISAGGKAGAKAGAKAAAGTFGKVSKVAGAVGAVVGIGFSVAEIVNDSINIHKNVSKAADAMEEIAASLEDI
ncbi:apolipoprotein L3-like [Haliotis cracherodii]|uniref:apolipoprotein L3-like n=1 Tax=Haliotis cracherodii TaxID=6455 RepID=UPI0039E7F018